MDYAIVGQGGSTQYGGNSAAYVNAMSMSKRLGEQPHYATQFDPLKYLKDRMLDYALLKPAFQPYLSADRLQQTNTQYAGMGLTPRVIIDDLVTRVKSSEVSLKNAMPIFQEKTLSNYGAQFSQSYGLTGFSNN